LGSQPFPRRSDSVSLDWRTPLSPEKNHSYNHMLHDLQSCYRMFSVNLDEAMGMRRIGRCDLAYQILTLAPTLCDKLTSALQRDLHAMSLLARHFGIAPNMAALDPENFRNSKSQRVARYNGILGRVLLTRRSQFLQKLSALAELVEDLGKSYEESSEELAEGLSLDADHCWDTLDRSHYDLTTCFSETDVLLKSFLLALPEKQLAGFRAAVKVHVRPSKARMHFLARKVAHRRVAALKGQ